MSEIAASEARKASSSSVTVTLPDGSTRTYDGPVTGETLATDIGEGLARAALAWRVDGEIWDIFRPLDHDAVVEIITRDDNEDALELIRHDAAHVMAMAVQELYPGTQVTIGPTIENGFYYDFARDEPFTPEDLEKIEARMKEIVDRDAPTRREVWDRERAVAHFRQIGEKYKAEIIEDLPTDEDIRIYFHGDWHDLCRGPHLASTAKLGKAFKLMSVAGAYWRGDSRNEMLQRIYGTAWRNEKELKAYLHRLEEAERRDHRRLAREMNLFHMQEEAAGMAFWHANGQVLWRELENYIRRRISADGYAEVRTPQLIDRSLWERSGHWEKFGEHMYVSESEERTFALKPMNCPAHIQIFNHAQKSYRDLPLRMAEFGCCHRYEPSGALHGLMRVRSMVQDDAHIFCTEEQVPAETAKFCRLLETCYADLGFPEFKVKLADRPEVRAGTDKVWDKAEKQLREALEQVGYDYELNPGEGAFYGPKLEFVLTDAIGREWQCGTLQLDFVLPDRLGAEYVGEDGAKHTPVLLHRAIVGTLERFIGILIEHHAGRFPLWLAPVQAVIATIVSDADDFARQALADLTSAGIRAETDLRNEKINYKIREHSHAKVPVILVAGKREADEGTLTVRRLGQKDQQTLALAEVVNMLVAEGTPPDLKRS